MNAAVNAPHASNMSSHRIRRSSPKTPFSTILLVAIALLASRAVYAATYTVTNTSDTNDGSCGSTCSLRDAVNAATSGSDTIDLSHVVGTITLTNGTLALNNIVTITGPGAGLLTISGNHAARVFTIAGGAGVSIEKLNIANGNSPTYGGAIYVAGSLTLIQCAFSGNTSTYGGAIYSAGPLTVTDSTFSGNTSTPGGGGGIAAAAALTVQDSTFSGNTSDVGGGILSANTALVENSTFFGNNSGSGPGGGVYNNGGSVTVANSTVTGNIGDGIRSNGGILTVTNSIVAGNTGGDCDDCGTQSANNMIGGTPDMGPLQYNGGPTETMMPLPGSPAIGAGLSSTLATDQRGFARPTSGASDLGAVSTHYLTVTTTADSIDTTTCTGGAICSLRDAIIAANSDGSGDVVFQSGLTGTIAITGQLAEIMGNLTITGTGATPITFSQTSPSPDEMYTDPGTNVALSGLTVTGPVSSAPLLEDLIKSYGTLAMNDCTFSNMDLPNAGGLINNDGGTLMVTDSTFSGNSTTFGGAILSSGPATITNSTFSGNRAQEGGAIYNQASLLVADSTLFGNTASNAGAGGGIYNNSGASLTVTNSILAGNTSGSPAAADDCVNCGTQGPANMIGGSPNLGALALTGLNATVQTMLPLPGSPAIQAGDATQLPAGLATDERGFPRLTGAKLDLGAAQTNYTSVQFVQQPTDTEINTTMTPAVTVQVLETNPNLVAPNNTDAVDGIPITLTFNGTGSPSGASTETTSGGVATFGDLKIDAVGTGNTLATTLTVTPTGVTPPVTLTATSSPFDVTLLTQTITFTPPPANVTYGVPPITLLATSSASLPVTFQVDSGSATILGNVLTITGAGTVVIEADALGNGTYAAASPVTETILVGQAASQLALTASATQAAPGSSITLTATATSTTGGTPTGTVTFVANGNSIGTAPLTAGVATLTLTTLPAGSNTITASYPGDANFLGSSAQLTGAIVVGAPMFTMTTSASSLSISPGQTGTVTLTLTPTFGYTGTVNFACNSLPLHSTCSFSPSSATFSGSATPVTVTLTVATSVKGQARSNLARLTPLRPLDSLPILPAIFFWLPGTRLALEEDEQNRQPRMKKKSFRKKSFRMLLAALLLVLGAGMLSLTGCGGGTSFSTPAGQQTVTITATGSGNVSQSIAVQVTVQ